MVTKVAVRILATDQNGAPLAYASVSARLNQADIDPVFGYIVPETLSGTTDGTGATTLYLWPNALGSTGSRYEVRVTGSSGYRLSLSALVPNAACDLHLIADELGGEDAGPSTSPFTVQATGLPVQSLTRVPVRVLAYDQNGSPVSGATVTAKLNRTEIDADAGYVFPEQVTGTTLDDGSVVLSLWPNALGVTESQYDFRITNPDTGKTEKITATIPNNGCDLHLVANLPAYEGKSDGQLAIDAAVASVSGATAAKDAAVSAQLAAESASTSAQASASTATTKASEASTSAANAATSAGNASSSATLAQAWATQTATEVVAGQGFGAKKYANDAAASAAAAATSAEQASAGQVNANWTETNTASKAFIQNKPTIPSATSQLTNDAGFITSVPTASATVLGGVKVGSGLSIDGAGVLSASGGSAGTVSSVNSVLPDGTGNVLLAKSHIGLGSVDNTPDTAKPVSTAQQAALDLKLDASQKGTANGVAPLDAGAKISATYLPSYVDDVLEYANQAAFPATGTAGLLYVAVDVNKVFRWSGTAYVEIVGSPGSTDAVPEGTVNLYHTTARAAAAAPVQSVAGRTGAVVLAKADVGLANVDDTADLAKPVSTATQTALDAKVDDSEVSVATTNNSIPRRDATGYLNAQGFKSATLHLQADRIENYQENVNGAYVTVNFMGFNGGATLFRNFGIGDGKGAWVVDVDGATKTTTFYGPVVGITKAMVGLPNVDDTADANKPVSTAMQAALDGKQANLGITPSYAVGDLLVADTTTTLTKISPGNAGNPLRSNGAGQLPSYSAISLVDMTTAWVKKGARVATTANLTASYASNVLTNTGTLAALVIDDVTLSTNNRVLVKDQTNPVHNGLYYVTNAGSASVAWVLTRVADCNWADEQANATLPVGEGTKNKGTKWTTSFGDTDTVGTSAVNWYPVWDGNNPTIITYTEKVYAPAAGTAFTVDLANGPIQRFTTSGNITITLPAAVEGKSYIIEIVYGGAHTVTFAGGTAIKWPKNTAPTVTSVSGKTDVFSFYCPTSGITRGSTVGLEYAA